MAIIQRLMLDHNSRYRYNNWGCALATEWHGTFCGSVSTVGDIEPSRRYGTWATQIGASPKCGEGYHGHAQANLRQGAASWDTGQEGAKNRSSSISHRQ